MLLLFNPQNYVYNLLPLIPVPGYPLCESRHEISNNVVCAIRKALDQPAHTHTLISAFASCLNII